MCGSACGLRRLYHPWEHTVRWCDVCRLWFHAECCHEWKRESTTTEKPGYLKWTGDSSDGEDAMWAKLLKLPIERKPVANVPVSFEIIILAARNAHKAAGGNRPRAITKIENYVRTNIGVPKTLNEEYERAIDRFRSELEAGHRRLRCPTCHQEM